MHYKAYVQASQTLWKNAIDEIEKELVHHQGESTLQYELVYAQYGLMYSTFAHKDKATFDEYIDEAKERMEKLLLSGPDNPHYHLMMSSLYDAEISYAPWKAMYLSAKSERHVGKAYKLNKNLPMVWIRKAVSKFFTPEMFGGDKKEALENYKKAIFNYF